MIHSIAGIIYYALIEIKKGGTGSGLGTCILSEISLLRNRHCATVNIILLPSNYLSTNNLEWYNATAALESINESCELTIMIDNQALYQVFKKNCK